MLNNHLKQSIALFQAEKKHSLVQSAQRVALQLIANIDIEKIIVASVDEQIAALRKLKRLIERERLKGSHKHWSYDLNRHIALKQAYDHIQQRLTAQQSHYHKLQ